MAISQLNNLPNKASLSINLPHFNPVQEPKSFQLLADIFKKHPEAMPGEGVTHYEAGIILGEWALALADQCRPASRKGTKTLNIDDMVEISKANPDLGQALGFLYKEDGVFVPHVTAHGAKESVSQWRSYAVKGPNRFSYPLIDGIHDEVSAETFGARLANHMNPSDPPENAIKTFKLSDIKKYLLDFKVRT